MKKTYKAELWDTIHKFFGDYNDHMMHAVLETDGKLDIELFKRAFAAATEVFPLFLTRFRAGLFRSKWVETDLAPEDAVQVIEGAELSDKERFLTSKIAEKKGPQVKIAIFRGEESDTVCFLINHMLFDGAAFKEWLALLSRCYTNLKYNPNYKDSFTSGSRKFSELYDGFSLSDKIKSAAMVDYGKKNAEKRGFPFEKAVYGSPMILTRAIDNGRFTALKAFSKKYGFTVNDVILAAYARAMARLTEGSSAPLEIDCIIDLRRYLPEKKTKGLTNFVSKMVCRAEGSPAEDIMAAVRKVHDEMIISKSKYPGLNGLFLLQLGYSLLPYGLAKLVMRKVFNNPLVAMSNIGVFDETAAVFEKPAKSLWLTGSVKYPPYFQLSLSTYRGVVTLCVAISGTARDEATVNKLFDFIEKDLESLNNYL